MSCRPYASVAIPARGRQDNPAGRAFRVSRGDLRLGGPAAAQHCAQQIVVDLNVLEHARDGHGIGIAVARTP
jgi:hypothetical protein